MAEAGSAVGHIEREADAFAQHLIHSFYHILGWAGLVACSPLVEPAAPEFRTHLWSIRTNFTKTLELLVDVGTSTEVHGPGQVIEAIVQEVG